MKRLNFNLAIGSNVNEQLGFLAYSCVVQNPTNAYWYLPQANAWILPFTSQVVISLPGVQDLIVQYIAPPTRQEPAVGIGELYLYVTDQQYQPNGGIQDNLLAGQVATITVTAPTNINNRQLQFLAQSVTINNPTPSWWYLPDQNTYIAPFTNGQTITGLNTQVVNVQWAAPVGQIQAPSNSSGNLVLNYTAQNLNNTPGQSIAPNHAYQTASIPSNGSTVFQFQVATEGWDLYWYWNTFPTTIGVIEIGVYPPGLGNIAVIDLVDMGITGEVAMGNKHIHFPYLIPAFTELIINLYQFGSSGNLELILSY